MLKRKARVTSEHGLGIGGAAAPSRLKRELIYPDRTNQVWQRFYLCQLPIKTETKENASRKNSAFSTKQQMAVR